MSIKTDSGYMWFYETNDKKTAILLKLILQ